MVADIPLDCIVYTTHEPSWKLSPMLSLVMKSFDYSIDDAESDWSWDLIKIKRIYYIDIGLTKGQILLKKQISVWDN